MTTRTFDEISALYGPAKESIRAALLATTDPDRFGKNGAKVGTDKPLSDLRLLLGTATETYDTVLAIEDEEEREELLAHLDGVGPGFFAVAAEEGRALEALWAERNAKRAGDKGTRETGSEALDEAHEKCAVACGKAIAALRTLAGQDTARLRAIDAATGTAETEEALAQRAERLAALGLGWSKEPALADLAADGRIHEAWAGRLQASATALRAAALEDTRRTTVGVTQAKLDHQDGVVLHLLKRLIDVFEAGHRADRRIPRLTPRSTYRFFKGYHVDGTPELVVEEAPGGPSPGEDLPPEA